MDLEPARNADNKNDANHCRISFKGFSTENLNTRFEIVKQFVEKFQGNDTFVCIDTRMPGPYSSRKPTNESFAQFSSRDARDRVLLALKDTFIKTATGNTIKVFRSKTDFIRSRDWAMGKKARSSSKPNCKTRKFRRQSSSRKARRPGRSQLTGTMRSFSASRTLTEISLAISTISSCLRGRGVA